MDFKTQTKKESTFPINFASILSIISDSFMLNRIFYPYLVFEIKRLLHLHDCALFKNKRNQRPKAIRYVSKEIMNYILLVFFYRYIFFLQVKRQQIESQDTRRGERYRTTRTSLWFHLNPTHDRFFKKKINEGRGVTVTRSIERALRTT